MTKILGKQQEPTEVKVEEVNKEIENKTPEKFENIENIDDFAPDSSTGLDNSFFDEPTNNDNLLVVQYLFYKNLL